MQRWLRYLPVSVRRSRLKNCRRGNGDSDEDFDGSGGHYGRLWEKADDVHENSSPINTNRMMARRQSNPLWTAPMSVTARTAGTSPEFDQRCRVPFWI